MTAVSRTEVSLARAGCAGHPHHHGGPLVGVGSCLALVASVPMLPACGVLLPTRVSRLYYLPVIYAARLSKPQPKPYEARYLNPTQPSYLNPMQPGT